MVTISLGGDAGYCIDRLEVTNQAYAVFLAHADASAPQQPPGRCDWNTSYAPAVPVDAGDTLPVLGVDWCDAYAYCRSLGRRLCGALGGGPVATNQRDLAGSSQWFRACSRTDTRVYPYGDVFNVDACADCDTTSGCVPADASPSPVGSRKTCTGGYSGISDMSGNAAEWEDGCDDGGVRPDASDDAGKPIPDPRYDVCYHRGGSFLETGSSLGQACLACAAFPCPISADLRSHHPHDVGLRCCLDY
jgi:formylglycine-generating enzyme required for sulfatase activity